MGEKQGKKTSSAEGKKGGQLYMPTHVVRVLVGMLAPYKGRVYDPCCGSGGMFVQSAHFVAEHQKNPAWRFLRCRPHGEQLVVEMGGDKLCSDWICP